MRILEYNFGPISFGIHYERQEAVFVLDFNLV